MFNIPKKAVLFPGQNSAPGNVKKDHYDAHGPRTSEHETSTIRWYGGTANGLAVAENWLADAIENGRFERPQLLFQHGEPAYLFTTSQGGKYMTASSFIFKIKE
ncbi:hypothetical protein [Hufsiella ginkgonis]|uniref:hypothetical protein n=1 Tax=Hufsiella ginkgonis TaxID=2695274 RepID=UPI001F174B93|nr:hypothetical protein [Hufsiella ginkgonis]